MHNPHPNLAIKRKVEKEEAEREKVKALKTRENLRRPSWKEKRK